MAKLTKISLYHPTSDEMELIEHQCIEGECREHNCSKCKISSRYQRMTGLRLENVTKVLGWIKQQS